MKLSQVIRRYLLLSLLVIMALGCISTYFIFKTFIHHSTDQVLYEYKDRVESYVQLNDSLTIFNSSVFQPQRLEEKLIRPDEDYYTGIKDTLLYNEMTGGFQPYRQLYFTVEYRGNLHLITLNQPAINLDDLLYVNVALLISIAVLFAVFIYAIEYYLKNKAWRPFSVILDRLRNYHLGIGESLVLENSGIEEFDELNQVINKMVNRINEDFRNTKNFSEDISHEMQTPLSIVKSKLELLQQNMPDDVASQNSISAISRAIQRLSKLSRSLSLLTKIRNKQYHETQKIDLEEIILDYFEEFNELIRAKEILLSHELVSTILDLNPDLASILISNLISNTIRHNIEGGYIRIILNGKSMVIENSCGNNITDSENLFLRMIKSDSEESTGLGLSIVKSICDQYDFVIGYSYFDPDSFRIEINFG